MLTVPSVVGVLSTSLSGALNSPSVLRFVVAIPGLSDINVAASITSNGLSGVSLRTQDHRLRDWLSDNQRDIEIGLKLETGKTVEIEVREDNSGATELSRGGA
jgi:hypothetical protein